MTSTKRVKNVGGDARRSDDIDLDKLGEEVDWWRWVDTKKPREGWDIGNLRIYNFIHIPIVSWDRLNGVWGRLDFEHGWIKQMGKLWGSDLPTNGKTFL